MGKRMAFLIGATVLSVAVDLTLAGEITLNPNVQHQTIEGWGAFLGATDANTRTAFRDAGMNIMRMSMPKEVLTASSTDWGSRHASSTRLTMRSGRMPSSGPEFRPS